MPVDPHAVRGFGSGADQYDRHRPGWPPQGIEDVLSRLGLGHDAVVLDLAAGTGKLTRELLPRVARVIAVEPMADMRRRLREVAPDAEVIEGTADAIPVEDAAVDAVFVAEAFHWFATPEAAAEIARVVRRGGGVALMWNLHAFKDEPWAAAVGAVIAEFVPRAVLANDRNSTERWGSAFDGCPFEPFQMREAPNELRTDIDGFVGHVMTWSHTRVLSVDTREKLAGKLHAALAEEHPNPAEIVIPLRTQVYWARRR